MHQSTSQESVERLNQNGPVHFCNSQCYNTLHAGLAIDRILSIAGFNHK